MSISRYNRTIAAAFVNSIKSQIDSGGGGSGLGTLKVYSGTMPADTTVGITSQVLLGTLTFQNPCGVESGGTLTYNALTQDSSADASGVATWARSANSAGTVAKDHDITVTGGGGALQMVSTTIVAGGPIAFTSMTETI
jgi:hypothetical protein